jgi:hypothetical protein
LGCSVTGANQITSFVKKPEQPSHSCTLVPTLHPRLLGTSSRVLSGCPASLANFSALAKPIRFESAELEPLCFYNTFGFDFVCTSMCTREASVWLLLHSRYLKALPFPTI